MRKTRSRRTNKRGVKRHTRHRGGENSPNPAAGAPAKVNKKPTLNLNKIPSRKYVTLGQIPGSNGSPTIGSFFPPGNEGFAFPAAAAAVNNRVEKIKKGVKAIQEQRNRVKANIEIVKERESLKSYYEDELREMEENLNRLKRNAKAAQMRGDTNEEESIQEYIESMKVDIYYKKEQISELQNNNNEEEY